MKVRTLEELNDVTGQFRVLKTRLRDILQRSIKSVTDNLKDQVKYRQDLRLCNTIIAL